MTIEALRARRTLHASRNPLMTRVLAEARIMREEGEGIPRMFEEMTESFLRPPEFNLSDGSFVATLRNEPIFAAQSAEWQTLVDGLRISTNQKRALLAFPEGFTNEQYRLVNDVDRDAARGSWSPEEPAEAPRIESPRASTRREDGWRRESRCCVSTSNTRRRSRTRTTDLSLASRDTEPSQNSVGSHRRGIWTWSASAEGPAISPDRTFADAASYETDMSPQKR